MGCAIGTVRYILFFFNFLLALAGLGVLILGITLAHSEGTALNDVLHGQLSVPATVLSVVGGCTFLFAFFGCCGALRESHCMVCTYAVLLLTLFLLQVAVAVLAYVYRSQAEDLVSKTIQVTFAKYKNDTDSQKIVDSIQQELKCCGSLNVNTPWTDLKIEAPKSCHESNDLTKPRFNKACLATIVDSVETGLSDIGRVAIAIGIVEVIGIVFALCLANSIRRSELRGYA